MCTKKNVTRAYQDVDEAKGLAIDFQRSMVTHRNHISEAISKNSRNAEANPQFDDDPINHNHNEIHTFSTNNTMKGLIYLDIHCCILSENKLFRLMDEQSEIEAQSRDQQKLAKIVVTMKFLHFEKQYRS